MSNAGKQLSNPFSTGGGGTLFEAHVQASFVVMMLTGGFSPCLPCWPIRKIMLQAKYAGYDTDDLIVFVQKDDQQRKLLGQIKHSISITEGDGVFGEVVQAAWNDFNNPDIFTKGRDVIALITGPLSATDISNVRTILERARHSEDASDLFAKIELARFSSQGQRNKLNSFRVQLKKANNGKDVTDQELFQFLRHFHLLGYDLDIKAGVTLSLLHSLLGQYSQENVHGLWGQLIDEVQSANKNAAIITVDNLPEEIQTVFKKRVFETIPPELAKTLTPPTKPEWNRFVYATELAIANLIGSWNEKSEADTAIIGQLAKEDYATWLSKVREIPQQPESPVTLKNGTWTVTDRQELWQTLGPRLFDDDLDRFRECVVTVLTERDPRFDLTPEERYAASIHGKVLKISHQLRKGFAQSLALLGSNPNFLSNCSALKAGAIPTVAVRDIFDSSDWILWGSLSDQLPLLAEAAPEAFLSAVEGALRQTPCPFDALFLQEGQGIGGWNYLTGLLWALETLAWDEQHLVRVTVLLGELASHDPGGNWANRPANSLTTIFLPWLPQTTATINKRKVALQTLRKEFPEVAWKLLLSLFPNQHQTSSGSHKPVWRRTISADWTKGVSQSEYWNQVSVYADMAVEMAKSDIGRLDELINHLDHLPQPSFERVLEHLSSDAITARPEDERISLWTGLVKFASKHTRFANAKWALSPNLVSRIEKVAATLAPQDQLNLHRRLFCGSDYDLYEEKGNFEEQRQKLAKRRQQAIRAILDSSGIDAVVRFAQEVESPMNAGISLGFVAESSVESIILPELLEVENKNLAQFTSGFVWGRYQSQGWAWVDQIDMAGWTETQVAQLLIYLPFNAETWMRSKALLGEKEGVYWIRASVNPYQSDSELYTAVDKLTQYGRPNAAISCLSRILQDKQPLDKVRTVQVLLSAVSSTEPSYSVDVYSTVEIIKALQEDPDVNPDDLFRIEWAYLPLLERNSDASPKLLEKRLASDADFFCEILRLVYRSKNEPRSEIEPTEQEMAIATNAYQLLREWQTPPGVQPDAAFSEEHFRHWLESVKHACKESGHIEVALMHIGGVLIYSPPDSDGLWIHHSIAETLNGKDADEEQMRDGFRMAIINTRGVHWVDPTGKPEMELATKYRQQAEEVENAGYQRLAATLRGLADFYTNEAKQIIEEHLQERPAC